MPREPFQAEEAPFPLSRDLQMAQAIGKINRGLADVADRLSALERETVEMRTELSGLSSFLRDGLLSGEIASVKPAAERKSVAAHAACLGKYSAVAIGLLGLVVQVASIWRPDLQGPLTELLHLIGGG